MPGRIIQAIRRAEAADPVFMLDEVDKLGTDFRGDPSSALLEVLDPEQNHDFRDHYLDVPFDLSQVMFIATANQLDPIPPALRDRMEVLELSGYTEDEKLQIAQPLPDAQAAEGARPDRAGPDLDRRRRSRTIISDYTREAGVRNLEREIGGGQPQDRPRGGDAQRRRQHEAPPVEITRDKIARNPGPRRASTPKSPSAIEQPGVATGLAWTPVGGDIIFIEATRMPGTRQLTLTGQLGDVMRESAQAALSCVRSRADALGIPEDFFRPVRHPHPRAGRRHAQGWPVGRHHHGDGAGLAADRAAGQRRRGDDRRDHPARPGAAGRRHQGEGAGAHRAGHQDGHPARGATRPTWMTCRRSCARR